MFYPTLAPVAVVGDGIDFQISNPYIKFRLLADHSPNSIKESKEKEHLAKEAFLHIIATKNGCKFDKVGMLAEIVGKCPNVIDGICDEEMIDDLKSLRDNEGNRSLLISTPELDWVRIYIRQEELRQKAEEIVYASMLRGDSHWDKDRHEYPWTLSKSQREYLINEAFMEKGLRGKRRMELAKEAGVSAEGISEIKRPYFCKLLWDRHLDEAKEIGMSNEEDVLFIAQKNLNAGSLTDALDLINAFLPDRKDLIKEIETIINILLK